MPEYVHYVVLELLKNAMRATMQAHGGARAAGAGGEEKGGGAGAGGGEGGRRPNSGGGGAPIVFADVPEVVISVRAHGDDDVVLTVADSGGGIPAEATDKVRASVAAPSQERAVRAVLAAAAVVASWEVLAVAVALPLC